MKTSHFEGSIARCAAKATAHEAIGGFCQPFDIVAQFKNDRSGKIFRSVVRRVPKRFEQAMAHKNGHIFSLHPQECRHVLRRKPCGQIPIVGKRCGFHSSRFRLILGLAHESLEMRGTHDVARCARRLFFGASGGVCFTVEA